VKVYWKARRPACGLTPVMALRSGQAATDSHKRDSEIGYVNVPGARCARNYPCMGHPGKRAPTVQLCDDPKGFVSLAERQHALGPNPIVPNLIAQGIPPDGRVDADDRLYGPIEGTPLPPGLPPAPEANPSPLPEPPPDPAATPNSFAGNETGVHPTAAVTQYNPRTGAYMTADGHLYRQSNLAAAAPTAWTDLVLGAL
jgi:hypothetical protein